MANDIRRRYDFVAGGLSAGMLTGDTLMQSAGLADLPAIGATEHAALSIFRTDNLGRVTQKEVVWVTAHTAGASTATVTRGKEGTSAQTWSIADRWSLTQLSSDDIFICTSATRPASPYVGQHIFETDTLATKMWHGSAWEFVNAGALWVKGAGGAFWVEERDSPGSNWALYATGTKFRINGLGTDFLLVNRSSDPRVEVVGQMKSSGYRGSYGASGNGWNGMARNGSNWVSIDWSGGLQFWVDVTNVKTFVIQHPKYKTKYLVHACVEGPENVVFYRGQAQLEDGACVVVLPDYFEALCAEEGRSVQLTCIADDPHDEWCPVLHATYPRDGRFWVGLGSGMVIPDQRFWWEVKAVRKDVPPLLVEPSKTAVDVFGDGPYTWYKERTDG